MGVFGYARGTRRVGFRPWVGRTDPILAAGVLAVFAASLISAPSASAAPSAGEHAWPTVKEKSVSGHGFTPGQPDPDPVDHRVVTGERPVAWPAPGVAVVGLDLSAGASARDRGTPKRVGDLPVGVTPAVIDGIPKNAVSVGVRVEVLDRRMAERAGYDGIFLRVGLTEEVTPFVTLNVEVDYSGFRHAAGGDWGARLRLLALPECALTAPERGTCQGAPLPTTNDTQSGRLSAQVRATATRGGTLLAVSASASGAAGSFAATSLSPSTSWNAGGPLGDFTWSYPFAVPPAPSGHDPDVTLGYSSSSVDGRTVATNNQPSWGGEGFDLWSGFIERRYKPCADDQSGGNNPGKTGDLCWAGDNAVMTLNGSGGELVRDDASGVWRLKNDDGTRIEKLSGAVNGDGGDIDANRGEYWKITTPDGTQYFFGLNRLPGWSAGNPETRSTWTTPVYGNQPGEPCRQTTYDASWCQQAWRWNLDYVVDRHDDVIAYFYTPEGNKYGRNNDPVKATDYVRGGVLDRIEYGQRAGAVYTSPTVGKVVFTAAERCVPGTTCTKTNKTHYPDVPWDQECTASPCTNRTVPSFWTSKRLAAVTTSVREGTGTYRTVDSWTLRHSWPDPGDGTRAGMWLDAIARTGHVGGTQALPEVTFSGQQLPNRVDGVDGIAPMNWWRIHTIRSETGGQIAVTYAPPDCGPGNVPASADSNTRRCMPVRWQPEDQSERLDWFHKYVVAEVTSTDLTTGLQPVVVRYAYLDGAAWRYTDDDGIIQQKYRTWSQWRGYSRVQVRTGHPQDTQQSLVETRYMRGMNGDRLASGGTRVVSVSTSEGGAVPDDDVHAGFAREVVTSLGDTGNVTSRVITDPWLSDPTATRVKPWGTTKAYRHGTAAVQGRHTLSGGGVRRTRSDNTFVTVDGRPGTLASVSDLGDLADPTDDKCIRYTHTSNLDRWILDVTTRVVTYAAGCEVTSPAPAQVMTDARSYYDGNDVLGRLDRGNVTRIEKLVAWNGGTPVYQTTNRAVYDVHGRAVESYDTAGTKTTTNYTPAVGGPVTRAVTTTALGHTVTSDLEPAWGQVTATTDANGKKAEAEYDPLGRVVKVWEPGRTRGADSPDAEYAYLFRTDGPSVVTAKSLKHDGGYLTSYTLYDGLLRPRQTQEPAPGGGRVVTDTVYNSRGEVAKSNGPYFNDAPPGYDILIPDEAALPAQTLTQYDGAGRPTASIFKIQGTEQWRTTTTYHGDRVDVTPPPGGTATTTVTNARGQTTELRQYHGPTPTGPHDATRYTYALLGDLASVTDPAGNTWRYTYNTRGQKIRDEDPDRGTTTYTYDDVHDELATVTDARGSTIAYAYDAIGRKTAVHDGSLTGPMLAQWTYDTIAKGHLTSTTRYVEGHAYTSRVTGYDDAYRPTGHEIVIPAAETGLAGTYSYQATYHPDGSPATSTLPTVGGLPAETLTYGYDTAFSLPITLSSNLGSYVTGSTYTPYAEPWQTTTSTDPTGATNWVRTTFEYHTGTRRLGRALVERATSPTRLANTTYNYDATGNVTRISDAATGLATDNQCFTHDNLRRLTAAWTPALGNCATAPTSTTLGGPAPYHQSWTFDKTGNRLTETTHSASGNTTATSTYPTPGTAQPHTARTVDTAGPTGTRRDSFTYDPTGNTATRVLNGTTQTLTWDTEGNLSKVTEPGKTTSYLYDAEGTRLLRRDPNGTTLYLGPDEVHRSTTGVTTATRYYTHQDRVIAVRVNGDGTDRLHWLSSDHHNTATLAIKASDQTVQRRYSLPYGDPRGTAPTAWPGEKGFVGGTIDNSTGLTHLGAREYDPKTGRFTSVDPILDPADPQQLNGYAYSNNSPLSFTDPDGLHAYDSATWAAYGAYMAGAGGQVVTPATTQPAPGPKAKPKNCDWKCKLGKGAKAAGNWVKEHKATIITIAVSVAAGVACGIVTAGAAAVACMVGAGALISAAEYHFTTPASERSAGGYFKAAAIGAASSLVGGVVGKIAGSAIKAGAQALGQGAKAAAQAAGNAAKAEAGNIAKGVADTAKNVVKGSGSRAGAGSRTGAGGTRSGRPAPTCPGNSFLPGTPVLLADGTGKPIEDVRLGDQVLATDPVSGIAEAKPVTALITGEGNKDLVEITVAGTGLVTATAGHPFWVVDLAEWIDAEDLRVDDRLETPTGELVKVIAIRTWTSYLRVHNLTVADVHTYYVAAGDESLLVHNQTCGPGSGLLSDSHEAIGDPTARGGVYALVADSGMVMRTGMAKNLTSRLGAHRRKYPGLTPVVLFRTNSRAERRGLEEIAEARFSPILAGQRAIRLGNPFRKLYREAARGFLERSM